MKQVSKKDLPEYVKKLIKEAKKDGADVKVIRLGKDGTKEEVDIAETTLNFNNEDVFEAEAELNKHLDNKLKALNKKYKDKLTQEDWYDSIQTLYKGIVSNCPYNPKRAVSIMLGDDDKFYISACNFTGKQDLADMLFHLAERIEEDAKQDKYDI